MTLTRRLQRMSLAALPLMMSLALAEPSLAATVSVQGGTVVFQSNPGESNQVFVTRFPDTYGADSLSFADNAGVPAVGDGCELATGALSRYAHCRGLTGKIVRANLGDRNDTWSTGSAVGPFVLNGEDGDDKLGGGSSNDTLNGGPGDDQLSGDEYYLGITDQGAFDQHGADVFNGAGGDLVSYYNHKNSSGVIATLDDQPNDGDSGEADNVRSDVEGLQGPLFANARFTGNDKDNALYGTGSGDTLIGNGGNDTLQASDGADALDGGAGDDALEGGADDDVITGGPGTDSFVGDGTGGSQQVISGNDRLFAKDGLAEDISCGPGADTVSNDPIDKLVNDGQNVVRDHRSAHGRQGAGNADARHHARHAGGTEAHAGRREAQALGGPQVGPEGERHVPRGVQDPPPGNRRAQDGEALQVAGDPRKDQPHEPQGHHGQAHPAPLEEDSWTPAARSIGFGDGRGRGDRRRRPDRAAAQAGDAAALTRSPRSVERRDGGRSGVPPP